MRIRNSSGRPRGAARGRVVFGRGILSDMGGSGMPLPDLDVHWEMNALDWNSKKRKGGTLWGRPMKVKDG